MLNYNKYLCFKIDFGQILCIIYSDNSIIN